MAGDVKNFPGGKPIVILGTDGTDLYGITVDTSGHVQVDVLSNALPTGAATETTLASVLAKLDVALSTRALEAGGNLASAVTALQLIDDFALGTNKIFAYNDRYAEAKWKMVEAAGNYTFQFTTVPAGEIWFLQLLIAADITTVKRCQLQVVAGANAYVLADATQTLTSAFVQWGGSLVLKAGDSAQAIIYAVALNDVLYARAWGYKMKIA